MALGPLDIVHDDEEVPLVLHLDDDVQLVVQALLQRGGDDLVPLLQSLVGEVAEVGGGAVEGFGYDEVGQQRAGEVDLEVAALTDAGGVFHRFRAPGEEAPHLLFALHVELVVGEAQAVGVVLLAVGADAEQEIVGIGVALVDVVDVVGADQGDAGLIAELLQERVGPLLFRKAVVLDLQVVAPIVEEGGEPQCPPLCLLVLTVEEVLEDLAAQAGGEADEALVVRLEQGIVDAGLEVEAIGVGEAVELHQVVVTGLVHRQEDEVVLVGPFAPACRSLGVVGGIAVELTADDRLDARLPRGVVEAHRPKHVAVVGDGQGAHGEAPGPLHILGDGGGPIEQREVGVVVQMDKCVLWYVLVHKTPVVCTATRAIGCSGRGGRIRRSAWPVQVAAR